MGIPTRDATEGEGYASWFRSECVFVNHAWRESKWDSSIVYHNHIKYRVIDFAAASVKTVDQLMAGLRNALLDGLDMSSEFFNLVPAKVPAKGAKSSSYRLWYIMALLITLFSCSETYYQPTPSLDGENIDKLGFCENLYRMTGIRPSTAGACEYYMPHFVDALMQYASFGSNRLDRENFVVEQARLTGVVHMVSSSR